MKPTTKARLDPFFQREAENYDNPIPSRESILSLLLEQDKALSATAIMRAFKMNGKEQKKALGYRLKAMIRDGQVLCRGQKNPMYSHIQNEPCKHGWVDLDKQGGLWVKVLDENVRVSAYAPLKMQALFSGDYVSIQINRKTREGLPRGTIIEVLETVTPKVVGTIQIEGHQKMVQPDHPLIKAPIFIKSSRLESPLKQNQLVVVEIDRGNFKLSAPTGHVIKKLKQTKKSTGWIEQAIETFDIPSVFSESVQKQADKISHQITPKVRKERQDLTHLEWVTIDGSDSKDFDDAVYCEEKGTGWKLWVAIADVSHYVKPSSALDTEAYDRGNSVYFPTRVLPMLPEVLSNDLCSLNPNIERLALVCEMQISKTGRLTQYQFYSGIIQSKARLTYQSVQDMFDNQVPETKAEHAWPSLQAMKSLVNQRLKVRAQRGALDFDLPEPQFVFENQSLVSIALSSRLFSHQLIEECMLCANEASAKLFQKHQWPALYRVHPKPVPEKLEALKVFLGERNLSLPKSSTTIKAKDYREVIDASADRDDKTMIQTVMLRSMGQAIYTPNNDGHFGLAYKAYTHFTSPIRRYPDLLVHRAIKAFLLSDDQTHDHAEDATKVLVEQGAHCSMTERRADEAVRHVQTRFKCDYAKKHEGSIFEGTIVAVLHFGLFVQIDQLLIDGLVHISQLDGYFLHDLQRHQLVDEKGGKRYQLGDKLTIRIESVSMDTQKIDLGIVEQASSPKNKKRKNQKKRYRKKVTTNKAPK